MSILKASAATLLTLLLSACGGDSGSNSESSGAEQTFISDLIVEVFEDLPMCTANREGVTVYVKEEKTAYVCSNSEWSKDDNSIYIERIEKSSSSLSSSTTTRSCSSQDKPSSSSASSSSSQNTESSSSETTKPAESSSSSSKILESSSSQRPFNPDVELIDSRDGRTYKKIVIGSQTWMAENLNYADSLGYPGMQGRNWCYNDLASNCKKKGRLYTWAAAMDSAGIFSTNGKNCGYGRRCTPVYPVRGICPQGWHLPTSTEFETLFSFVGGQSVAGKILKSTSEWNGRGEDSYGFTALPSGVRFENYFNYGASCALFLSASEYNSNAAYALTLDLYRSDASMGHSGAKFQGGSVRCIQDGTPEQTAESSSSGGVVSSSSSTISSSSLAMSSSSIPKSSSSSSALSSSSSAVSSCSSSARSSSSIPRSSSSGSETSGFMTDPRDGQTYRIVKIGDYWWMAQNLNYATENSYCYKNDESYCTQYGRSYTWAAAVGKSEDECGKGHKCSPTEYNYIQGVCPKGWHIPFQWEWEHLIFVAGGGYSGCDEYCAGKHLKSSSGWKENGNGTDDFGFSALPFFTGGWDREWWISLGENAFFWTATEDDSNFAYYAGVYYGHDLAQIFGTEKSEIYSVRCVKD